MLQSQGHSVWLKLAQNKSTNIILVYFYVHVSLGLHFNLKCCAQFVGYINQLEEVTTGGAEGNIFSLHC